MSAIEVVIDAPGRGLVQTRRAFLRTALSGAMTVPLGVNTLHALAQEKQIRLADATEAMKPLLDLAATFVKNDAEMTLAKARHYLGPGKQYLAVEPSAIVTAEAPPLGQPIDAMLAQAFERSDVVSLPFGVWRVENGVVPAGKTLLGPGTIAMVSDDATLSLGSRAAVIGIDFRAERPQGSILTVSKSSVGTVVANCSFVAQGYGVGVRLRPGVREAVVTDCNHRGGEGVLYAEASSGCRVTRNVTVNATRGMQFFGGRNNTIERNVTIGGIVGILFLSNRSLGIRNLTHSNNVSDNWIILPHEEGVSFDCHGNKPDKWPEFGREPVRKVSQTDDGNIIFESGEDLSSVPQGAMAVGLSGEIAGSYSTVKSSSSNAIELSDQQFTQRVASGDFVIFTSGFFGNRISGNIVYGAGTYGVGLWGSSWDCDIRANIVSDCYTGIMVASVVGDAPGTVKAFCGNIRISANAVIRGTTRHKRHWMRRGTIVVYRHTFGQPMKRSFSKPFKILLEENNIY